MSNLPDDAVRTAVERIARSLEGISENLNDSAFSVSEGTATILVAAAAGAAYFWRKREIERRIAKSFLVIIRQDLSRTKQMEEINWLGLVREIVRSDRHPNAVVSTATSEALRALQTELSYLPNTCVKRILAFAKANQDLTDALSEINSENFRALQGEDGNRRRLNHIDNIEKYILVDYRNSAVSALLSLSLYLDLSYLQKLSFQSRRTHWLCLHKPAFSRTVGWVRRASYWKSFCVEDKGPGRQYIVPGCRSQGERVVKCPLYEKKRCPLRQS